MSSGAIARYLLGLFVGLLVIVVALHMVKIPVYGVYAVLLAYVGGAIVSRLLWMD